MLFITPYLLTFMSFVSYSYLLGTYSFIHKNMTELFQISKTQLGIINGVLGLASTSGVVLFLMYSTYIKPKIVTYYTWGCIGYMLPFALIVLGAVISQHPSKLLLYFVVILMGVFRSIFFPSLMIMIKMHKQIYDRNNHINQHNYKLLTNIWSVSFDVGMAIGFFGCNWLQYTIMFRWEYLVMIGLIFMLTTTTILFLGLRSYLEEHDDNQLLEEQSRPVQNVHDTSFFSFFSLIDKYLPSKLFLVNSTIVDALHLGFCFVLPAFFYDLGYKGNQGYLTAIYSLFIVLGAWLLAISDFVLHKISEKIEKSKKNIEIESRDQAVFSFIFSGSLFFFALTLIMLTILSFQSTDRKRNGILEDQSNLNINMILMCSLGFFFGGPLKSYFSYRTIKAMGGLEKVYVKEMTSNSIFFRKEQEMSSLALKNSPNICDKIKSHQLQIGTSLITTNRILTHFTTVIMFIIAFYLIEQYLSFAMAFLAFLGILGFIFDVIQNIVAVRYEQMQQEQKQFQRNISEDRAKEWVK